MFEWRDHLSYNRAYSIAEYDNKIYCAVTIPDPGNDPFYKQTNQGIYYFDKNTSSYEHLSKVNGLSDTDPILLKPTITTIHCLLVTKIVISIY